MCFGWTAFRSSPIHSQRAIFLSSRGAILNTIRTPERQNGLRSTISVEMSISLICWSHLYPFPSLIPDTTTPPPPPQKSTEPHYLWMSWLRIRTAWSAKSVSLLRWCCWCILCTLINRFQNQHSSYVNVFVCACVSVGVFIQLARWRNQRYAFYLSFNIVCLGDFPQLPFLPIFFRCYCSIL